jgi:hypothetical protein
VSRISSVSSQDSGFTSQEQFFARPPSPLEESEVLEKKPSLFLKSIFKFSVKLMEVQVHY